MTGNPEIHSGSPSTRSELSWKGFSPCDEKETRKEEKKSEENPRLAVVVQTDSAVFCFITASATLSWIYIHRNNVSFAVLQQNDLENMFNSDNVFVSIGRNCGVVSVRSS